MNQEIIKTKVEEKYLKQQTAFGVGDTIAVSLVVREGDKKRIQLFKGIVIAIKGSGISKSFTIRKISAGIGVEKILPYNSPNIAKIVLIRKGAVRRSKIYYMRKRIGKKALKVNEGAMIPEDISVETEIDETNAESPVENATETAAE